MKDGETLSMVPAVPARGRLAGAAKASTELGGETERDEMIELALEPWRSWRGRMNVLRLAEVLRLC